MSYSSTETSTYTATDVEAVMRRITADLVMIAASTGAVTETCARNWAHDIELLAKNGYLNYVDLTLISNGVEKKLPVSMSMIRVGSRMTGQGMPVGQELMVLDCELF